MRQCLDWLSATYLADAADHVVEKSVHGLDLTLLLVLTKPHADADGSYLLVIFLNINKSHLDVEMGEVLDDRTTWSLNGNDSGFDGYINCIFMVVRRHPLHLPPAGITNNSSVKVCLILLYLLY